MSETAAASIAAFWRGVDTHDWDLVGSVLAPDFVRVGMRGNEADTCRGREAYLRFVSTVVGRMHFHELRSRRTFLSADGRSALNEAVEVIQPVPSAPRNTMSFANVMSLDEQGLITRLDIYWKTPDIQPPDWITVDAILGAAE